MNRIKFYLNETFARVKFVIDESKKTRFIIDKSIQRMKFYIEIFTDAVFSFVVHIDYSVSRVISYLLLNANAIHSDIAASVTNSKYWLYTSTLIGKDIDMATLSIRYSMSMTITHIDENSSVMHSIWRVLSGAIHTDENDSIITSTATRPRKLSEYTFTIGDPDMTLFDWCRVQI